MIKLQVFEGGRKLKTYKLSPGQEYHVGRAETCHIQLPDRKGISRHHFTLSEQGGIWKVSVTSHHGGVHFADKESDEFVLTNGCDFSLKTFTFKVSGLADSQSIAVTQDEQNLPIAVGAESYEAQLDSTVIAQQIDLQPILKIISKGRDERIVEIKSARAIVGRDDTADIVVPDRKVSRRQFEIRKGQDGFEVCDLGSANGTHLNSKPLEPERWTPIQSGDRLSVQSISLFFELRDPHFEKRLASLPALVPANTNDSTEPIGASADPSAALPSVHQSHAPQIAGGFEVLQFPVVAHGNGAAVRIDGAPGSGSLAHDAETKKKRFRILLIVFIIGAVGYSQFEEHFGSQPNPETRPKPLTAFEKLTEPQKKTVETLYVTARNLYLQGKFESTLDQLNQLHVILPDGYEASREIEDECKSQRAMAEELRATEQERMRLEAQRKQIEYNLRQCDGPSRRLESVAEIRKCLALTLNFDPENAIARDYIARVETRVTEKERRLAEQKDFQARVAKGKTLFDKAQGLRRNEKWFKAIDAYQDHLQSNYPDPAGLKAQSTKAIDEIRVFLDNKIDTALKAAQDLYDQKNLRDAIESAKIARSIDPQNQKTNEFIARARKELTAQLRVIYEDAILHEGVGQIELAQSKWRQIIERDTTDGQYYQKSKIKLRNYSEQIQ